MGRVGKGIREREFVRHSVESLGLDKVKTRLRNKIRKDYDEEKEIVTEVERDWVLCDSCGTWRPVPEGTDVGKLKNDWWVCSMTPGGDCDISEEEMRDGEFEIRRDPPRRKPHKEPNNFINSNLGKELDVVIVSLVSISNRLKGINSSTDRAHPNLKSQTKIGRRKKRHHEPGVTQLPDVTVDLTNFRMTKLPCGPVRGEVVHLQYLGSGEALLALLSTGIHKLWGQFGSLGRVWKSYNAPVAEQVKINKELRGLGNFIVYYSDKNKDIHLLSVIGGEVFGFSMSTRKNLRTFKPPPPAVTFVSVHPDNSNILALGMLDSTVCIFCFPGCKVTKILEGHAERITGLAFSRNWDKLVSAGADAQLCVWDTLTWGKLKAWLLPAPSGLSGPLSGDTKVLFNKVETCVLVVHESQISIYDSNLECLCSWSPRERLSASISSAAYSCDGSFVFVGFRDGALGVFGADKLELFARIPSSAYLSLYSARAPYPTVIASHPSRPSRIALGMSDGTVLESDQPQTKQASEAPSQLNYAEDIDSLHVKARRLHGRFTTGKVVHLMYMKFSYDLLALSSNAEHKLWKCPYNEAPDALLVHESSKSNTCDLGGLSTFTNDCRTMLSVFGGNVTVFKMQTKELVPVYLPIKGNVTFSRTPPPSATILAINPLDDTIAAIGMDDFTIRLYNFGSSAFSEFKILKGHEGRISGLVFSQPLKVLVSSGVDAKLCVWEIDTWEMAKFAFLQAPSGQSGPVVGETRVHLSVRDQLLVVNESQLSVYNSKLERLYSWSVAASITSASYSSNGLSVYVAFRDGSVGVFNAALRPIWRIPSTAYLPQSNACLRPSNDSVYPTVVASHSLEPYEVAVGMSSGAVYVIKLTETLVGGPPERANTSHAEPPGTVGGQKYKPFDTYKLVSHLAEHDEDTLRDFFRRTRPSDDAWILLDSKGAPTISVLGSHIQDLLDNSFLEAEIMNFYIHKLEAKQNDSTKRDNYIRSAFMLSDVSMYAEMGNLNGVNKYVREFFRTLEEGVVQIFVPIYTNSASHWTLLYYNFLMGQWSYYDSQPGSLNICRENAEMVMGVCNIVMAEMKEKNQSARYQIQDTALNVPKCAKQVYADCLIFVCYFMKGHMKGSQLPEGSEELLKKIRNKRIKMAVQLVRGSADTNRNLE